MVRQQQPVSQYCYFDYLTSNIQLLISRRGGKSRVRRFAKKSGPHKTGGRFSCPAFFLFGQFLCRVFAKTGGRFSCPAPFPPTQDRGAFQRKIEKRNLPSTLYLRRKARSSRKENPGSLALLENPRPMALRHHLTMA